MAAHAQSLAESRPGTWSERRSGGRINRRFSVRYRTGGLRYHQGQAVSVSVSGARIVGSTPLMPGARVHLTLQLEAGWSIATAATVVWCRELSTGSAWVTGLAFGELWQEDSERLGRWVRGARPLMEKGPAPVVVQTRSSHHEFATGKVLPFPIQSSASTSASGALCSNPPVMPDLGWL